MSDFGQYQLVPYDEDLRRDMSRSSSLLDGRLRHSQHLMPGHGQLLHSLLMLLSQHTGMG